MRLCSAGFVDFSGCFSFVVCFVLRGCLGFLVYFNLQLSVPFLWSTGLVSEVRQVSVNSFGQTHDADVRFLVWRARVYPRALKV